LDLKGITTLLLDGDGVLWKADEPVQGTKPFFDFLVSKQTNWALLTNNNTRVTQDYVRKLRAFNIEADESIVFTSPVVTVAYALERFGTGAALHVIGMEGLKTTLQNAGFKVSFGESLPDHKVLAVVAGEDLEINFNKIKVAMRLIQEGAAFLATNTDSSHPTPEGINPGTGLVVGALKATTRIEPIVMGKPQSAMFEMAMKRFDASPENTLMVGDTLETDILGASKLGISSALVLSGVTTREAVDQSEIKPDHIFNNIMDLHQAFRKSK